MHAQPTLKIDPGSGPIALGALRFFTIEKQQDIKMFLETHRSLLLKRYNVYGNEVFSPIPKWSETNAVDWCMS